MQSSACLRIQATLRDALANCRRPEGVSWAELYDLNECPPGTGSGPPASWSFPKSAGRRLPCWEAKGLTPSALTATFMIALIFGGSCEILLFFFLRKEEKCMKKKKRQQRCIFICEEKIVLITTLGNYCSDFYKYACIPLDFFPLPPHVLSPLLYALGCFPDT